ncbi:hypothetical protein QBC40DRAFT_265333 [Triangularia verruculosa]|uniref:Uncharacterized protein n=1 Tax=Triangularia verruculosa TaxID=2587418 RepID=A0AAN6XH31_9PEZI|nr:hypothetical protein QBC40DRAFT_265333 [Triangularia verruculosa]
MPRPPQTHFLRSSRRTFTTTTPTLRRPQPYAKASPKPGPKSPAKGAEEGEPRKAGPAPRWKRLIWTGAFAATTFTGAIYGAGLKTQQEWKQEKQKIQELTTDEKVAMLENSKGELWKQKVSLEQKLREVRARMEKEKQQQQISPR